MTVLGLLLVIGLTWTVAEGLHNQPHWDGIEVETLGHTFPSSLTYGTTREYGHVTSNAKRSWLHRHYGVPYRKHGRLFLEPGPYDNYLGTVRETAPGDDTYDRTDMGSNRSSLTVDLYYPR